ncbi:hypothetical protein K2X30_15425 [bacterium]|nr:hypothetical protein [bacterium]
MSSPVLPLPQEVVKHHLENLGRWMSQWLALKRFPPVLLLSGPAGVGKRSMAYYLSQWLLCENTGKAMGIVQEPVDLFGGGGGSSSESATPSNEPCGTCTSCQKALSGNWIDFTEILPDADSESSNAKLKIDQFRNLKASQGFGAFDGSFRIFLIPGAENMTQQAANSVLKILEEPPPGWIFILTTNDPSILFSTLVSRCQIVKLKPFSETTLSQLLAGQNLNDAKRQLCARLAQGSWGKAFALTSDEFWEKRQPLLRFLENPQTELNELIEWATEENPNFVLLLDQLELLLSDLIQWSAQPPQLPQRAWFNTDASKSLETHARAQLDKRGSPTAAREFWFNRHERVAQVRKEIGLPLNRKLLVQDVLMGFL